MNINIDSVINEIKNEEVGYCGRNLLLETYYELVDNEKTFDDINFIALDDIEISVEDFINLAKDIVYNYGYGLAEISEELVIVGNDWWLEREEYDGSEWWEFRTKPEKPEGKAVLSGNGFRDENGNIHCIKSSSPFIPI